MHCMVHHTCTHVMLFADDLDANNGTHIFFKQSPVLPPAFVHIPIPICPSSGIAASPRLCVCSRYGHKTEATGLLQEWVKEIGSTAGLTAGNTRLSSGSIGVPESRLEVSLGMQLLNVG